MLHEHDTAQIRQAARPRAGRHRLIAVSRRISPTTPAHAVLCTRKVLVVLCRIQLPRRHPCRQAPRLHLRHRSSGPTAEYLRSRLAQRMAEGRICAPSACAEPVRNVPRIPARVSRPLRARRSSGMHGGARAVAEHAPSYPDELKGAGWAGSGGRGQRCGREIWVGALLQAIVGRLPAGRASAHLAETAGESLSSDHSVPPALLTRPYRRWRCNGSLPWILTGLQSRPGAGADHLTRPGGFGSRATRQHVTVARRDGGARCKPPCARCATFRRATRAATAHPRWPRLG
jgi:hypothetical protein